MKQYRARNKRQKANGLSIILTFIFLGFLGIVQGQENSADKIRGLMTEQERAWNEGDIKDFMKHYWESDSLRFLTNKGLKKGWQPVLDGYLKSYPDQKTMGQLNFTILSVDILSEEHALVLGKWHLDREEKDLGGAFCLLWKKINGEWKIVVDHTS